ncbi:MAG: class I SAM-dependent methyltransferase [Lachnospiraceae bacterium]|nr:class I SAM-dependent methyltransferase [Lachnospiraceae bacterium]
MNTWKTIWNKKKEDISALEILGLNDFEAFSVLKKMDGFDVGVENAEEYYKHFYDLFDRMFSNIKNIMADREIKSVFEVGCGSGVNLYMFKKRLPDIRLGGIDYSESFVNFTKQINPGGEFCCDEAINISVLPKFDVVLSDSVFQYFESLEYAEAVLTNMISKCDGVIYLGEIHDKERKVELLDYRRKTIEDYDEKYKYLSKLFIDKKQIKAIADRNGKKVIFENCYSKEYLNSKFIYNCYIY